MWTPLWKSAVKAFFQKKFLFVYLLTKMCVISRNLHHVFEEFQHISINHMMAIILKYWGQTSFHGTKWRPARWMLKDHYINIMHADYLCGMPDMLSWLCRSTLENLENNVTRFQKGWYNIEIVFMACWRKYSMFRRRLLDRPSRRNVYKVSDCKYYY